MLGDRRVQGLSNSSVVNSTYDILSVYTIVTSTAVVDEYNTTLTCVLVMQTGEELRRSLQIDSIGVGKGMYIMIYNSVIHLCVIRIVYHFLIVAHGHIYKWVQDATHELGKWTFCNVICEAISREDSIFCLRYIRVVNFRHVPIDITMTETDAISHSLYIKKKEFVQFLIPGNILVIVPTHFVVLLCLVVAVIIGSVVVRKRKWLIKVGFNTETSLCVFKTLLSIRNFNLQLTASKQTGNSFMSSSYVKILDRFTLRIRDGMVHVILRIRNAICRICDIPFHGIHRAHLGINQWDEDLKKRMANTFNHFKYSGHRTV